MDRDVLDHLAVIEGNQKTIHDEIKKTYRELDQAFRRVFIRLDELEREIKRRPLA